MRNYLTKKSDALTPEICISGLIAKDGATLNFVKNSEILSKLFAEFFNYAIPSYHEIRNTIIRTANITKALIKDEVSKFLLDGKIPTVEFDEWTSRAQKQIVGIILNFPEKNFHIGLCEIKSEQANAEAITQILAEKLEEFGVNMENLRYFTADGAATNGAVSKLTNLKIQKCHNHGIHLGI